ncbi:hypothetical protein HNR44_001639 [Geomicrobium halophilum]|uniref:Coat F domain-containing protein n=1 Tax=Geomicrobium halophilum TaxID=549000 RepID=A0A841PTN2_9BACL|nr:spore coat protein [Geomicrobium halophilum]MBB6449661.1 hypothetical protein [Geomicrobium halophilum]
MILTSIDLGLISEHLNIHQDVIRKLKSYYCLAKNPQLQQIIYEQVLIMRNHADVMLMLMDPERNEEVDVSALHQLQPTDIPCKQSFSYMNEQNIAFEARNTAMTMAQDNFNSSLSMNAQNVRNIHLQMALQQFGLQSRYSDFIESKGWDYAPNASIQEQIHALKSFQQMYYNL